MAPLLQHSDAAGELRHLAATELDGSMTRNQGCRNALELQELQFNKADEIQRVGDGAVDVRGRPCIRSKTGNWRAFVLIIGCEACERVGFNAISSNLVGYLTTVLREDLSVAVQSANNWSGTVRLTPIIGAIIADSYLGRFMTIGTFMCVFLVAQVLVATSVSAPSLKPQECQGDGAWSCPPATRTQVAFFYGSLYLMAVGAGGIRSCVFPMAGDQFDVTDASEAKRKLAAPNGYFIAITAGSMLGVTGLVFAQERLGWSWGYGIPVAVTALCALAFLAGMPFYRNQLVSAGSPLKRVAQVLVAAARNRSAPAPAPAALISDELLDATRFGHGHHRPQTPSFSFLDKATSTGYDGDVEGAGASKEDPWRRCSEAQVEEVKRLWRMLPIWGSNIMFWVVYAQLSTLFLNQGTTLDRHVGVRAGGGGFQIPAASMPLFLHISICLFLPIYGKLLVPVARRFTGEPRGFTVLQRIAIGQALSVLPIAIAALVEVRRLRLVHSLEGSSQQPLPMSIFWLLPQYALMGVTEVFLSVGQIEFFTEQAPQSMRSLGNAMACSAIALGSFGSSLLVELVTKVTGGAWIRNDMNKSHVDYFYWLLVILMLLNLVVYLVFARRYRRFQDLVITEAGVGSDVATAANVDKRVHPVNAELAF